MEVLGGRTASLGNRPVTYPEPRVRPAAEPCSSMRAQELPTSLLPCVPCLLVEVLHSMEASWCCSACLVLTCVWVCALQTREELLQFPVMPQGHLNYAATWFTLAAAIAVSALVAMRRRRLPQQPCS